MEGTQAVVAIVRAEPIVSDQVNVDKWKLGVPFRTVDNFWVTVRVAYPNVIIML